MNTLLLDLENRLNDVTLKIDIENEKLLDIEKDIDNFEPDIHDQYDEMLDEIYQDEVDQVSFVSLPCPSELLKENDPVAYRCGYNDFVDSFDFESLEEYNDLVEQKEEIENNIESLGNELEEIQEEIEQLEEENENV
ncbi:MAG: hypothetical protein GOVbin2917_122 [Prokaryotic dsDNA virus sp.]|jgi:predicted ribosome quality control (RQC) complex YloA/Tae2 family protein|nr:MAG: hypothetical protein GOVbin2917_122 [Prokaryotic dsDNA virus sp.]|tara:strand:+ start:27329 stop:27739 length:411 start_codon:yes stop_codon:yes gene_type:complete